MITNQTGRVEAGLFATSRRAATQWYLVFLYINYALFLIKGVMLVPLYLTYVEPHLYGAWLASGGIIGYLAMLEFGVNRVLIQRTAQAAVASDSGRLASLMGTGFCINATLSTLPFLLGLSISPLIPPLFGVQAENTAEFTAAFIVAALSSSVMMFSFMASSTMQGLQRQVVINICFTGGLGLGILTTVLAIYRGYGLVSIPLGSLVHALVTGVGDYSYMLLVTARYGKFGRPTFSGSVFRDLFRSAAHVFSGSMTGAVTEQSDKVVIGSLLNPLLCNVYVFTGTAYRMLSLLVGYVSHAMMPSLAHLGGQADPDKLKSIIGLLVHFSLVFASVVLGGALFLNQEFVHLWVGPQYYGGEALNALLLMVAGAGVLSVVLNNTLVAMGQFPGISRAALLEAVVYIPLVLTLACRWGLPGVAAALVAAKTAGTLLVRGPCLVQRLRISPAEIRASLSSLAAPMAAPLLVGAGLNYVFSPATVTTFVAAGCIYTSVAIALSVLLDRRLRELLLLQVAGRTPDISH